MLRQFATASKAARLTARTAAIAPSSVAAPSRVTARFAASSFRAPTAAAAAARPFAARWYSSEAEPTKKDEAEAKEEVAREPLSAADAAALRTELETKAKELQDFKDKYLRSVADFRNLQERTQREMKAARDYAITQFAKDLVDSVDNLDRALTMVPADKLAAAEEAAAAEAAAAPPSDDPSEQAVAAVTRDLANLVDGLKMTETVLLQTLKKHGLERFDPVGEKFNPNEHEATFMTPNKAHEHNTVFHTQQKGFRLNGRVLRAAKVGVVNNK